MNIRTIVVAALLSVAVPSAVWAQVAPDPGQPANELNNDASALGTDNDNQDFDTFLKGFSGANFTSATTGLDAATTFRVVKLSSMANADATKMQPMLDQHANDLSGLRGSISGNAKATAALQAAGVTADQVVWIESGQGGDVTLYVSDFPA